MHCSLVTCSVFVVQLIIQDPYRRGTGGLEMLTLQSLDYFKIVWTYTVWACFCNIRQLNSQHGFLLWVEAVETTENPCECVNSTICDCQIWTRQPFHPKTLNFETFIQFTLNCDLVRPHVPLEYPNSIQIYNHNIQLRLIFFLFVLGLFWSNYFC